MSNDSAKFRGVCRDCVWHGRALKSIGAASESARKHGDRTVGANGSYPRHRTQVERIES